jgi:hypothetical protein
LTGLDASPAVTTCCMFFVDADANTSAGAPLVIWVASVELAPKLNVTFTPGCAASNCWPMVVNASFSEDAANTVIDPDSAAEEETLALAVGEVEGEVPPPALLVLLPDEQPARAAAPAMVPAMTLRLIRRTMAPRFGPRCGE